MKDFYFFMCTTPHDEKCAQLGDPNYHRDARSEAEAFIEQLQRRYGEVPSGAYFKIVECPHDFGVYLDVRFSFDDGIQLHMEYLNKIQESLEHWDEIAKERLRHVGYYDSPIG